MARPSGLAYSIHTPRLILRCWYPTDANLLQRAINDNVDYLRPVDGMGTPGAGNP